jgi:hypothetical protein
VYRATEWLYAVEEELPGQIGINWCYLSLYQINHPDGGAWKVWEQPSKDPDWQAQRYAGSLRAFWAAEAARQEGEDAFRRFHRTLLQVRHQHGSSLDAPETFGAAAEKAGLDRARFERALADVACRLSTAGDKQRLATDHTRAVSLGVFGTPTLVFPGAEPVYLKLNRVLSAADAVDFWEVFRSTAVDRPYVLEIKRPH